MPSTHAALPRCIVTLRRCIRKEYDLDSFETEAILIIGWSNDVNIFFYVIGLESLARAVRVRELEFER